MLSCTELEFRRNKQKYDHVKRNVSLSDGHQTLDHGRNGTEGCIKMRVNRWERVKSTLIVAHLDLS